MSDVEIYGNRDLTYSHWHRTESMSRFMSDKDARKLAMIDLDNVLWVECTPTQFKPLVLIETARDIGQTSKTSTMLFNLAVRADLRAYSILYRISHNEQNVYSDIEYFRVKQLYPKYEDEWQTYTPVMWALTLIEIRHEEMVRLYSIV